MFVRFFKSNNASSFIFLPFIALAIWVFGFIFPSEFSTLPLKYTMPLFELIAGAVKGLPLLSVIIAFMLVITEAFLLNYIVNENEVIIKQSYLPALLYIVFMSNSNAMLVLHPSLFANLFLLLAVNKLLDSYRKDRAFSHAFDSGMLLSIASLFYFPYLVFFPLLGIAFILLRPFIWREWVIAFIGVILPYVFTITFYFLNDTMDYFWYDKLLFPFLRERSYATFSSSHYFLFFIGGLILLFSFARLFGGVNTGTQKTKKGIVLMIWIFLLSFLVVIVVPEFSFTYYSAFAIPVSVFCAHFFVNFKKEWWAELLFLFLISSVFVNLITHFF